MTLLMTPLTEWNPYQNETPDWRKSLTVWNPDWRKSLTVWKPWLNDTFYWITRLNEWQPWKDETLHSMTSPVPKTFLDLTPMAQWRSWHNNTFSQRHFWLKWRPWLDDIPVSMYHPCLAQTFRRKDTLSHSPPVITENTDPQTAQSHYTWALRHIMS